MVALFVVIFLAAVAVKALFWLWVLFSGDGDRNIFRDSKPTGRYEPPPDKD